MTGQGVQRLLTPGRVVRFLGVCVIAGIALGIAGFGLFATHVGSLATPDRVDSADAIVVLTGGQFRLDAAVDLLKSGKGRRLLISGVNPTARPRDLASATGTETSLFRCCVDVDYAALDTIGNATESAKWVKNNGFHSIILVTNNYHMPRSLLEMGRALDGVTLQPYAVVNTPLNDGSWLTKPRALRVLVTEYAKYLLALGRGAFDRPEGAGFRAVTAGSAPRQ